MALAMTCPSRLIEMVDEKPNSGSCWGGPNCIIPGVDESLAIGQRRSPDGSLAKRAPECSNRTAKVVPDGVNLIGLPVLKSQSPKPSNMPAARSLPSGLMEGG